MARFTDNSVKSLKPREKRYALPDPECLGHYIRVHPSGRKSFCCVARDATGKQVWTTIGESTLYGIDEARAKARETIKRVKARSGPGSFREVAELWLKRHVYEKKLRTAKEMERLLDRYIYPEWGRRAFVELKRSDVAALLDVIQDGHGPRQADCCLTIVRAISNWYATRQDDYVSPFVRGMRRSDPQTEKRARILDDDELRAVWKQAEANGTFGAIIRLLLLTAQRREKVATMRWADVSLDGEWRIPTEEREKGNAGIVVLPDIALQIISAQPRFASNPFVFAGRADGPFNGFSPCKRSFDRKLPIPNWTLHDLRRTARSLMSRAGVRPDIAERVMGHVIPGVEGVYDRHSYRDEKADALARLAVLIDSIISPPVGNVVSISR